MRVFISVLCDCKTSCEIKDSRINILKKIDAYIVYMYRKFKSRKKMKKQVIIKTIRTGIDMGVSPRLLGIEISCINARGSYFESDVRSLSAPYAIYNIFIVNSLQTRSSGHVEGKDDWKNVFASFTAPIMSTALNFSLSLTFWATVS